MGMSKYKVVLFDVDGVLLTPPKMFSDQYCEQYPVDKDKLVKFYATKEFKGSSLGKFDLKDAIRIHNNLWQWNGSAEELLRMWFEAENFPNNALLETITQLRGNGTQVYIATQQERYRKQWLEENVFTDTAVDGIFCTCDLGYEKHDDGFWELVTKQLRELHPGITPSEIAYFDDKQHLVDTARKFGIDAYLYANAETTQNILQ
jgi:FMN phosphatase YigB (HAD superfamily)